MKFPPLVQNNDVSGRAQCNSDIARIGNPSADAAPPASLFPPRVGNAAGFKLRVERYNACKRKRRGSSRRKFGHSRWAGAHVPSTCSPNRSLLVPNRCQLPTDRFQPGYIKEVQIDTWCRTASTLPRAQEIQVGLCQI